MNLVEEAKYLFNQIPDDVQRFTWDFRRKDLMRKLIQDGGLNNFLQWPVSHEALFAGWTEYAAKEAESLYPYIRHLAKDPEIGRPPANLLSIERTSGTMIRQFLIAHTIDNEMCALNELGPVIEIGGGYGALAYAMRSMGFRNNYYVYDFPELHLIRNWYLHHFNISTESIVSGMGPIGVDLDILIAVHSLCEMPVDHRKQVLEAYPANWYVIYITKMFDGINNYLWFKQWFRQNGIRFYEKIPVNTNQAIFIGLRSE